MCCLLRNISALVSTSCPEGMWNSVRLNKDEVFLSKPYIQQRSNHHILCMLDIVPHSSFIILHIFDLQRLIFAKNIHLQRKILVTLHRNDKAVRWQTAPFWKAGILAIRSCGIYLSLRRFDIWLTEAGDECSFKREFCDSAGGSFSSLAANGLRMDVNPSLLLYRFCVSAGR